MRLAAPRLALGLFAALVAPSILPAASDSPARSKPSRPGPLTAIANEKSPATPPPAPVRAVAPKHDAVDLTEVGKRLQLKVAVDAKGERIVLSDASRRAELQVDSREAKINGVRVFLGDAIRSRANKYYIGRVDYATRLVPLLQPAFIARPPDPKIVVIDPGHGGADNGMENSALGLKEKVLTLDVAQRLKKLLETRGYKVVLTRDGDASLHPDKSKDFDRRIELANKAGADLFVSIHFNSLYPDVKIGGTEVYTFTRVGQRSDRSWGFGQVDDAEPDASPVNHYDGGSTILADALHRAVLGELKTFDRGQKTMHSVVLRGLKCPGALIEAVFLSSEVEGKLSGMPAYRQRMADALADGIDAYAKIVRSLPAKS